MNIQQLSQAPPETSQYLDAQLLVIGLAKVVNTQRGQRCVQELQVVDRQGQKETIGYWYDADKPDFAMPPQQINRWLRWKVKTKPKGQYLNISGYPEKEAQPQGQPYGAAQYAPPPQAPPQEQSYTPPPQAPPAYTPPPQQPAQRVPSEWDKPIDWHDKKQLLIVRQSSISNAVALLKMSDSEHITTEMVLVVAKRLAQFVYDGVTPGDFPTGGQPNPEYNENPPLPAPGDKF